jgi:hypothetical protein
VALAPSRSSEGFENQTACKTAVVTQIDKTAVVTQIDVA